MHWTAEIRVHRAASGCRIECRGVHQAAGISGGACIVLCREVQEVVQGHAAGCRSQRRALHRAAVRCRSQSSDMLGKHLAAQPYSGRLCRASRFATTRCFGLPQAAWASPKRLSLDCNELNVLQSHISWLFLWASELMHPSPIKSRCKIGP